MFNNNFNGALATAVQEGLSGPSKSLPAFMLYDERGSTLFEEITRLPEYYLTRAERSIFVQHARAIAARACALVTRPLQVLELGAGTAKKSQILLHAMVEAQGQTIYVPADVAPDPLFEASRRLQRDEPLLTVRPLVTTHEEVLDVASALSEPLFVWFLGSSIGNYSDVEATRLLSHVRAALGEQGVLLLGADIKKSAEVLVPAYDDKRGVTAQFNKNVLLRINRELGGHFDLDAFRHVALWNERGSRMEMHLESTRKQDVMIDALGLQVSFEVGERIHTESSHKYDREQLDALFGRAGLKRVHTFLDAGQRFAVHLARPS
ncbi:MAG: L-histidine N(alpha)-methyltransferase [Myxococcales bacterium]